MKLYPQTSPDSVQAWTQEDFGYAVDSKIGLESALETIFPACSPASSSATQVTAAVCSSSFAELKPVPPLKALTQCHFIGSSAEALNPEQCGSTSGGVVNFYPENAASSTTPDLVSTTTAPELSNTGSVMMKPPNLEPNCGTSVVNGSGGLGAMDHFLAADISTDDDFAAIIGNAMSDPQLVVPDSLELGNFTSSDMHELEAWIEGQSQARLQRIQNAVASSVASGVANPYGAASPMLQNLLSVAPVGSLVSDNSASTFGTSTSAHPGAISSMRAGPVSGNVGSSITGVAYTPNLLSSGATGLHHRLQKPLIGTFSPPSYATLADTMSMVSDAIGGAKKRRPPSSSSVRLATKMPIATEGTKDRPVHRCTICNRGFLNKSNIKVHLRTHTGEKPFKCETCNKAFRQKAHLLKHYHIHKRMTRD